MKVRPAKNAGEVVMEVNRRDESLLRVAAGTPFRIKTVLVPIDFSSSPPLPEIKHLLISISLERVSSPRSRGRERKQRALHGGVQSWSRRASQLGHFCGISGPRSGQTFVLSLAHH